MEKKRPQKAVCKSCFQEGAGAATAERFTEKWIRMLHAAEKNRQFHTEWNA